MRTGAQNGLCTSPTFQSQLTRVSSSSAFLRRLCARTEAGMHNRWLPVQCLTLHRHGKGLEKGGVKTHLH